MLDILEAIRGEHTLTDGEIKLLTDIGSSANEELTEAFDLILEQVLGLRETQNSIDSPQKAKDLKRFDSNNNKLEKFAGQLERQQALADSAQEKIDKAIENQKKYLDKIQEIKDQTEIINTQQVTLGPDRKNYLAENYLNELEELTDTIMQVDEIMEGQQITDILPFLNPYIEEYGESREHIQADES